MIPRFRNVFCAAFIATALLPPAVLACEAAKWQVFFESGSLVPVSGPDDAYNQTLKQFVLWWMAEGSKNFTNEQPYVLVVGHSDGTGSQAKERQLSLQRAEKVASDLVRLGFLRAQLRLRAAGAKEPQDPISLGKPEPFNNNVELNRVPTYWPSCPGPVSNPSQQ